MSMGHHEEEQLGKVYDRDLVRRLWPYMWHHKAMIGAALLPIPLRLPVLAAPAVLFGAGLDYLVGGEGAALERLPDWLPLPGFLPMLAALALLMLFATTTSAGLELLRAISTALLGQRVMRELRQDLFAHVQRLPMKFFDHYPVGRLVTRLSNDVESLGEAFSSGIVMLFADLLLMGFFAYLLFQIDVTLALVSMSIVPVLTIVAVLLRWKAREAFRTVRVRIAQINGHLQETISGMKVVQLFAREERNLRDFSRTNAEHRRAWFRSINYESMLTAIIELAQNLTVAAILWFGAGLLDAGTLSLGTLFIFVDWMRLFFRPVNDLAARYSTMQSSMASFERITELMETPAEPDDGGQGLPAGREGEVEFDNVSFGYGNERVLKNVSFRVAPGERVAFVGATGAGKTTVLKLLQRLYSVTEGTIRVGGRDIREISRTELRRRMAFVLQDVFLFRGGVEENISLGRPEISLDDVKQAAATVYADRVIERLPLGYQEPVLEQGVNFSAGERQLLAFARALAQRPEILLLDEATASVDTETEALLQEAVHRLIAGKTSMVVAHRLSTIQDVDRIYVLHHGEIREVGSHEELLELRGLYWRLYQIQYAAQERPAA